MQAPYRVCMLALATEKSGENVEKMWTEGPFWMLIGYS